MAKISIYVPDELLERARATDPAASISELCQRGLERLLGYRLRKQVIWVPVDPDEEGQRD